jgi:hypothetical protein
MSTNIPRSVARTLATVATLSGRIYEGTFPQPPAVPVWPAARFTFVGNTPYAALCGDSDIDADDVRVQIDLVVDAAGGTAALHTLRRAVIAAMSAMVVQSGESPLPSTRDTDLYEYDAETKTHRFILDFLLFSSSSA